MKKVIIVLNSISRAAGGLQNSVRALAIELSKHCCVEVFAFRDRFSDRDLELWGDVSINLYWRPSFIPTGFSYKMICDINRAKADCVYVNGFWLFNTLVILLIEKGQRVVLAPRGMLDPWALTRAARKKRLAWHLYAKRAARRVNTFHSLAPSESDAIRRAIPGCELFQLPNGVQLNELPSEAACRDAREGVAPIRLLFLGRIDRKKNIESLVAAFKRHIECNPESKMELTIAGWPDGNFDLNSLFRHSLTDSRLQYVGATYGSEKYRLLTHSHYFVLPSLSEGLPMSVIEAAACGVVPAISKYCNFDQQLGSGEYLDSGVTVDDICQCLARIETLHSSGWFGERSQLVMQNARRHFDIRRIAQSFLENVG
jgi:poly(glycerol-phosphate) alpha-glucosyltransferase